MPEVIALLNCAGLYKRWDNFFSKAAESLAVADELNGHSQTMLPLAHQTQDQGIGLPPIARMPTMAGMKASQSLLSFALAILLSSTGWARIGETIDQCGVRYGDPFNEDAELVGLPDSTALFYRKSGLMMIVGFWRGKAVILTIGRPTDSGSSEQLSDVEVETLLAANAPGKWKKLGPLAAGFGSEGWISEDGKVWAKQEKLTTNPVLQIMTKEYIDAQNAAKAAKDKQNLDGF